MKIRIKRVYDTPSPDDGLRVLIDRLWPRGLKKADAAVDIWARQLAPSSQLRKWFGHEESRFAEFSRRYRRELASQTSAVDQLVARAGRNQLTILYAAKNNRCNNAVVFKAWLARYLKPVDTA